MVKSETRRDAEILVRNPSPRLFGKKFRDSKKVNTNHAKTRLRDLSKTLPRFRDTAKIFRDPGFSRYHSPPLSLDIRPSYAARTGCNGDHVDDEINNTKDRVSNNLHPLCFHQRGLTKMQIKKITVKTLIIIALV